MPGGNTNTGMLNELNRSNEKERNPATVADRRYIVSAFNAFSALNAVYADYAFNAVNAINAFGALNAIYAVNAVNALQFRADVVVVTQFFEIGLVGAGSR